MCVKNSAAKTIKTMRVAKKKKKIKSRNMKIYNIEQVQDLAF